MHSKTSALGVTKKAFTFIELVVVITIIVLISSSGVIYFFRQISSIKLSSEIEKTVDIIDILDSKIENKNILDYNIKIKKSDKIGFTYSENNLGLDCRQKLDLNLDTSFTGTIKTTCSTGQDFTFKIYAGIKFQEKKSIDSNDDYKYFFGNRDNYKILSTLSGTTLNNIFVNYYSLDNLILDNENRLELSGIYGNYNKTLGNFSSVEIKNLNGKKYIIPDGGNIDDDIDKIYLFFEREGVEKFIEIKK